MNPLLEFIQTHEEAFRSRARLASLYSDFRLQRSTNPDGYAANSSAWLRALTAAGDAGLLPTQHGGQHDRFVVRTGEELARALQTPQYGRPLALGSVLQDAVQKRELIPLGEFLSSKTSVYATSWLPTPSQVVSWGLKQLGIIGGDRGDDRLVAGDFVLMSNLESATKVVLDEAAEKSMSNTSRIFTRDLFVAQFSAALGVQRLSPNDLSVLITHLSRDSLAISYDAASATIKFKSTSESTPPAITQEDISIASIRSLIASLEPQVGQLNDQVVALNMKAREAVSTKNTVSAKSALRSKRLIESTLQQRLTTLHQLDEVYHKIEQAADQVEIVRVMETAGQTLKTLNARTGGVDKAQDIMEGLREEMVNADEISQVINETGAEGVDEVEVEDELEEMEKLEREKGEAVEARRREEHEEMERKERAKHAEEEAEKTRQRLAELDQLGSKDTEGESAEQTEQEVHDPQKIGVEKVST